MANPIVVNNFQAGISDSPVDGIASLRNIDIMTYPGVARVNYDLAKQTGSAVQGLTKWVVRNTNGTLYALDSTCTVWKSTDDGDNWTEVTGNTKTGGTGQGLGVWKNYLFVARDTHLDVMKISDESWTNGWQTIVTADFKPILVGQDDILYIGNGRYISSLQENAGSTFAPGTGATFTWQAQALDLPNGYNVKCLAELGVNMLIGTTYGASNEMTIPADFKLADVFPWDRVSPSFDIPLRLNENGVHAMVNKDNIVYILAGLSGNIFATNGTTIRFVRRIPETLAQIDFASKYLYGYPGAIMVHKSNVFFGISAQDSYANGVWSLNTVSSALNLENQTSTDDTDVQVGAMLSVERQRYIVGWQSISSSAQGIDLLNTNDRNSVGYIDSQLYRVGTIIANTTYSNLSVQLGRPLETNQSVEVWWRQGGITSVFVPPIDATYTQIAVFNTVGEQAFNAPANIENVQEVQLLIVLNTNNTSYTPELVEVRLE